MRINQVNNNNNYQPNFKSINIIQVNKTVFSRPEELEKVQKGMLDIFDVVANGRPKGSKGLLEKLGLKNSASASKIFSYLEQPRYVEIRNYLKSIGDYSLSWLSQNKKVPIREPLDADYHSFFVYTKEHKDLALKIDEQVRRYATNKQNSVVDLNQYFIKEIAKGAGNEPITTYRINSVFELPYVFSKIEM